MTGCRGTQKRLKRFSDGEVGSFRKGSIERHLAKCVRCRQVLAEMRALDRLLGAYEGIDPPEDGLAGQVLSRAREKRTRPIRPFDGTSLSRLRPWFFSPYGWATAGLFLAGILAGQLIAASIRGTPGQGEQSERTQETFDLEVFSEIPPDSLEQRYWEALAAGQGGNG